MKNQKGITLVSLVITIIVMAILASVGTIAGLDSIKTSQKVTFITQLEMIQKKVNTIYEKRKANVEDKKYYDNLGQELVGQTLERAYEILKDSQVNGFKYFSTKDLEKLDLDNISQDVLINFDTRQVYSYTGIIIDGVTYYCLEDIPNYTGYNIEYINKNNLLPSFSVEVTKQIDKWKISLNNIVYNSNVDSGELRHKLYTKQNWILDGENTSFIVDEPGLYDICLTDKAGNSTIIQKMIYFDYVEDGLIAYYDAECNVENGHNDKSNIWKDLSGNKNNATLIGYNQKTFFNKNELIFDGENNYVDTGINLNTLVDSSKKEFSLSATIHIQDNNNYRAIMGSHEEETISGIFMHFENGNLESSYGNKTTWVRNKIDSSNLTGRIINITSIYKENESIDVYINGELKNSVPITGKIELKDTLYIGKSYNLSNSNRLFKGTMQNIKIYNKALTKQQVEQNYKIDKYRYGII